MKTPILIKVKPENILKLNDNSWVLDPTCIHFKDSIKFHTRELLFFHPLAVLDGVSKYNKEEF